MQAPTLMQIGEKLTKGLGAGSTAGGRRESGRGKFRRNLSGVKERTWCL